MSEYVYLVLFASERPAINLSCLYVEGTSYYVDDINVAYNRTTGRSYPQKHYIIVTIHTPTMDVVACDRASSYSSKES